METVRGKRKNNEVDEGKPADRSVTVEGKLANTRRDCGDSTPELRFPLRFVKTGNGER